MDAKELALVTLGRSLREAGYRFVTVTPTTHRRVLARPEEQQTLRSIFGWNRPFQRDALAPHLLELLSQAGALAQIGEGYRSTVRFASIGDMVFAHSPFPTVEADAVFFGPDTYRFVRLVRAAIADPPLKSDLVLVDVGAGSGAGGLCAARLLPEDAKIVLADINARALAFSAVNAAINDVQSARAVFSDVLAGVEGEPDLIIANPPYLVDQQERLYRHGGGNLGISLAARIATDGLARLAPGGRLVLYTGTPIIAGIDPFFEFLEPLLKLHCSQFIYEEIDPDVFGEELEGRPYAGVDRIAAVGVIAVK
ncbi:MAG TPA: class I SAM-dependent methyltransferase [Mesorhizobium sp.]|nr:class I SAM-dependent methyltransferase [Mesorhizobium sp.]